MFVWEECSTLNELLGRLRRWLREEGERDEETIGKRARESLVGLRSSIVDYRFEGLRGEE